MLDYSHEVFFEVATQLSFSKASVSLYISQPAITKHIQSLERSYGVSLFVRSGHTISLTAEGKILLDYIIAGRDMKRHLLFDITRQKNLFEARGFLSLGTSTTISLYVIPPVFSAFHQQYPNIELQLINSNSANIVKALLNHEIDLAITEGKTQGNSVQSQFFLTDEVVPVCSAKSDLARKKTLPIAALKEIPVALRERGSGTLAAVSEALLKNKLTISDIHHKITLGGTEALKNFLLDDTCLGFLPLRSVAKQLKSGELVRLHIPGLSIQRSFYFVQRRGTETNRVNQLFIRMALAHYNKKL